MLGLSRTPEHAHKEKACRVLPTTIPYDNSVRQILMKDMLMDKMVDLVVLALPRQSLLNPSIELLYSAVEKMGVTVRHGSRREIATGQYDIVHYHWVDSFLNHPSLRRRWTGFIERLLLIFILKLRRKKSVWTMHNIQPHEQRGRFLPFLYRLIFFWSLDGIIALSDVSAQVMLERYPALRGKPLARNRNGSYRSHYPYVPPKDETKQHLVLCQVDFCIAVAMAVYESYLPNPVR